MKTTPLAQALARPESFQPSPLTVFKVARQWWLEGHRISIGDLAGAVGVSRVTLYRWVGSRGQLVEEVLWSFAKPAFENAVASSPGTGVPHLVGTYRRFMTELAGCEPLVRFILENPAEAIHIQTNDPKGAHGRIIKAVQAQLIRQEALGHLKFTTPSPKLAEMIVWSNSSLVYSAIVGLRNPHLAIDKACTIDRSLLQGSSER